MRTRAVFNCYGQLVAYVDGRDIVAELRALRSENAKLQDLISRRTSALQKAQAAWADHIRCAPFNLDACWTMVDPLNGHERVAAVRA